MLKKIINFLSLKENNLQFNAVKNRRFSGMNYNKPYVDGYNFAIDKLSNNVCIRCLVSSSAGPDNHDEGLRDACKDFEDHYSKKLKPICDKTMFCKV